MATVRIYKVAELLGTTSQEVTALLKRDHGIEVKSASSTIEEVVARQFVDRLARQRNISLPSGDIFAETPRRHRARRARPPRRRPSRAYAAVALLTSAGIGGKPSGSWSTVDSIVAAVAGATVEQLSELPGIGEKTAEKILPPRAEKPSRPKKRPLKPRSRHEELTLHFCIFRGSTLATVRIYRVAELLGTTSQEVTALLKRDHGIEVKSASSTIEEVVARQFVDRLARQRNISLPSGDIFAENLIITGKKGAPARKPAEPPKPVAPALPPPRLVKTVKPPVVPPTEPEPQPEIEPPEVVEPPPIEEPSPSRRR